MTTKRFSDIPTSRKLAYIAGVIVPAALVWLIFAYFGAAFAFVLLPAVAISVLAYRMHQQRLAQKTREISEASRVHLATVEALATAIDARDQIGIGHVRRTQIYAVGIGRLLELPDHDIQALRTGALLHDIGKLAVPDHILNKPGSLTPAELEKTKIHSQVGASILESVGFNYPVIPTIKYHHEAWDGSGYPDGLRGDEIPLTARILAVADAFDTLRGARPYRPALPRDKARAIIQAEAGQKFDPSIVSLLLRNLTTLEADIDAEGLSYAHEDIAAPVREKHKYIEQIKLANKEVFSLYELAREFSGSVSLEGTLSLFGRKIAEFVPFDTCAMYLLDTAKRAASAVHVHGLHADELAYRTVKVGQGATGHALKTRATVLNVDPDLDFPAAETDLRREYTTLVSVPLLTEDGIIGAVTIYSQDLPSYGEEHVRLLETISRIAADAIGKSLKHDEARTHAMTDPMTGLPNARSLQMQFEKEVARASRSGSTFQLLMLDLDGFKAVNDSFGHKVGDQMLKEISKVIRAQLRDYDFLARYGGDEFVAVIPETDPKDVIELCDRIERSVSDFKLPVGDGIFASVGVSLGASGYPKSGETLDQMLITADKTMYVRKTSRKKFDSIQRPQPLGLEDPLNAEIVDTPFIVELDESHVISPTSSIN